MLDGRHTGTGGGNHVVLGGPTPADSPFLRRPDLLRSLVGYWQNHPSLSYLFSGLFVGPTSQAPRVDEARNDSLYELEIAFAPDPRPQGAVAALAGRPPVPPPAGRRHRQHPPHRVLHRQAVQPRQRQRPPGPGRAARLRDAAARAHEPGRSSCWCAALVARFWQQPYRAPLVRWGTALHDRFMLPHFVGQDFARRARRPATRPAIRFERDWFAPHFEFRFPLLGARRRRGAASSSCARRSSRGTSWARRPAAGGTARYVDSSVERVQVKVSGMTDGRHVVTCNGRRVPLHPTGTPGEYVAGVRYRAWQPPIAPAPDHRRARAAGVRRGRHLDRPRRSAAAPITSSHPGGRSLRRPSRSTRSRPRAGASRASSRSATRPGR